jgi:tripartite-type tricarboxylate transporter receptor subunit TctC
LLRAPIRRAAPAARPARFAAVAAAVAATLFAGAFVASTTAHAQAWPAKPVRVIVQFPPGGTPDIYGRLMSQELTKAWNQSVVVENRTGAAGVIGSDAVAKAPPDGYTLLFASDSPLVLTPHLVAKMPYDVFRDFTLIANVTQGPFVLLANPSAPFQTLKEFVAAAKAKPGSVPYASSGNGSTQHLAMELIRIGAGLELVHVPYKGFGQGLADVMAGQVPLIFGGVTASIGLSKSGKVRALGVTSAKRVPALGDVPTIAETIPGYEIQAWYGFLGPAGMPPDLVRKINADVNAIVSRPDFLERMAKDGIERADGTPEQFAARLRADSEKFAKIVKAAGLKPE